MSVRPTAAALAGLRTMRRKPATVIAWAAFWLLALLVFGFFVKVAIGPEGLHDIAARARSADPRDILNIVSSLGGVMLVLIAIALFLGSVLSAAIIRSVLEPTNDRFFYLRFGREELRLLVVSLITWGVALGVTVIPTGVLVLGTALLSGAAQGWFATLGTLAIIGFSSWVAVRLSLLGPHAFSHHHIDVRGAWVQTHGQFWRLVLLWVMAVVLSLVLYFACSRMASALAWLITTALGRNGFAGYSRQLLTALLDVLLAPLVVTFQMVVVNAAVAVAFRQLNQDEIDAGLHD